MMARSLTVLLVACLATACVEVERTHRSWHGRTVDDLAAGWGAPSEIHDQDGGGRMMVYRLTDGVLPVYGGSDRKALVRAHCVVSFVADARGVITASSDEGTVGGCALLLRDRQKFR